MSAIEKLLTNHIDIWTAADTEKKSGRGRSSGNAGNVYGIKKLRELILELAVRGKLVPQDANDEPASVLLKRIQAEKARLVAEGTIKKQKPQPPIAINEKPFEIPDSWEWLRLDDISPMSLIDGDWIETKDQDSNGSIRLVQLADIGVGEFKDKSDRFINQEVFERLNCTQLQPGDILIARLPSPIGRACLFPDLMDMAITVVDVAILRPLGMFYDQYVVDAINSKTFRDQVESFGKGATRFRIATGNLKSLLIPFPPLTEQHRIVAKVDELMALCDQLETQHSNAADAHEKLVSHLLGTLTQSPVPGEPVEPRPSTSSGRTEFEDNWQRIAAHFDTLFTTEASIDALKQTLLQLAVMGKLVPQDPNDEPASELVKRVVSEKNKLLAEKKYQKTGKLNLKAKLKGKYPEDWIVVQIGEICPSVVPNRDKPKTFSGDIPWITLPSFPADEWYLDTSNLDLGLTIEETNKYSARVIPVNSVLMSCIGRFGLTAINHIPVIPNQQIHAFIVLNSVMPEFLSIVIRVSGKQMEEMATSTTIAYLNKSNCESIEFGLPPSAEQHRIVAKVDELMALCDQLKARLTDASQLQQKLADVLVEQAVYQEADQCLINP